MEIARGTGHIGKVSTSHHDVSNAPTDAGAPRRTVIPRRGMCGAGAQLKRTEDHNSDEIANQECSQGQECGRYCRSSGSARQIHERIRPAPKRTTRACASFLSASVEDATWTFRCAASAGRHRVSDQASGAGRRADRQGNRDGSRQRRGLQQSRHRVAGPPAARRGARQFRPCAGHQARLSGSTEQSRQRTAGTRAVRRGP